MKLYAHDSEDESLNGEAFYRSKAACLSGLRAEYPKRKDRPKHIRVYDIGNASLDTVVAVANGREFADSVTNIEV